MTQLPFELVVFDIAGTTVHDGGEVVAAFEAAAREVGLTAPREELIAQMGTSKIDVFDALARRQHGDTPAAATARDAGYAAFRRNLEGHYHQHGARAIGGAEAAFDWLRAHGVPVALNTGFYREVTDLIVDAVGFRAAVDVVICSDDVPAGRPFPYMIHAAMRHCHTRCAGRVVVIGDTPSDARAAANAGAGVVVGVTSGSHTARSLRRQPITHLLDSVRSLPPLLERLARLRA